MAGDDDAREAARQRTIADACLLQSSAPTGRLQIYRRLVQTNLSAVARRLLPRTALVLDRHAGETFDTWFARFLDEAGPRTPYLRDVPVELVAWASPRWEATPELPAFVADLARHEVNLFLVESAPASPLEPLGEIALDRPLVFVSPHTLAHYDHAVETLSEPLPRRPTTVLIHRDAESTVHTTVVARANAELLALLLAGAALARALEQVGLASTDDLAAAAAWLAELGESGALLGGRSG
jgi:hypothetical protein